MSRQNCDAVGKKKKFQNLNLDDNLEYLLLLTTTTTTTINSSNPLLSNMAPARERSSSPKPDQTNKKQRTETSSSDPALTSSKPAIHLPDPSPLAEQYENAPVYKHLSVGDLFQDSILQGVVKESKTYGVRHEESSLPGWGWEEKHTDIYKIR